MKANTEPLPNPWVGTGRSISGEVVIHAEGNQGQLEPMAEVLLIQYY
jgi:hypothetical protein